MGKQDAPHRAVLRINLSLHALMNTGECSARFIPNETLEKCGLQEDFLLTEKISGIALISYRKR